MLLKRPWLWSHNNLSLFSFVFTKPLNRPHTIHAILSNSKPCRVFSESTIINRKKAKQMKMGGDSFICSRNEEGREGEEEGREGEEERREGEEEGREENIRSSSSMGVVLPALDVHVHRAVNALRKGHVIAIPTDTLYGLAADACSAQAVEKIYAIKGRNSKVPLAVCLAHPENFDKYSITSYLPEGLLQDLFPGPVTTVLQRGEHSLLNEGLNPGLCSIGIRVPDSLFIRKVVEIFGGAIALTSANISGQLSTIQIQEFSALWPHCAFVFDAGELPPTREGSTVVDLTIPGTFKVLRSGRGLESTLTILGKYGLSARE